MSDKIREVLDQFSLEEIALIAEQWRRTAERQGMTLGEFLSSMFTER